MSDNRSNSRALFERLHFAALRLTAANNIGSVGKDGRARVDMEWITSAGILANLLREIGGEIPLHAKDCAARKSPIKLCNCEAMEAFRAVVSGKSGARGPDRL